MCSSDLQYQQEVYQEPYAEEEKAEPKPFAYGYGGVDSQGLQSSKTENQDKDGVVRGEYRVELPDGRTQIVSYTADHEHGYQAEVRYEGEARPVEQEPNDYRAEGGEGRVRFDSEGPEISWIWSTWKGNMAWL